MRPLFLGYTEDNARLELSDKDLQTHVHGIGASRSGKSKLIEWICRELVRDRRGFCLIDPHGSVYDELVRWLAYLEPRRDVILFNPSHEGRIVGFNPFTRGRGEVSVQVDRRVLATLKAWGARDADETPRLERWLRCLYTLLVEQGYPIDVARYLVMWAEKDIRDQLIQAQPQGFARSQWEELAAYKNPKDFADQIESTRNRLFRFLDRQQLRRIMALSDNTLDFENIIEGGKILLVHLRPSDVLTDENARLIGTLLLNEIWEVGMRREVPPGKPEAEPPWFLIIDEFQKFLTPDIPAMLDQAAKRGIHLMLFHQHLAQLEEEDPRIAAAVMTNARIKLAFGGLSRSDARRMAEEMFPGQIDLKRVKYIVEQTKFWPVYSRDKIYTSGHGGGETDTHGSGSGTGFVQATALGSSSGGTWDPNSAQWFSTQHWTSQRTDTAASSHNRFQTEAHSTQSNWQEGEADIPVFVPVPFKEPSSVQLYSLDELLWELADRLMEQYQRHFMARRPGRETIAAVTPNVNTFGVRAERIAQYVERLLTNYPTAAEVDRAIEGLHSTLAARAIAPPPAFNPQDVWTTPVERPRRKG